MYNVSSPKGEASFVYQIDYKTKYAWNTSIPCSDTPSSAVFIKPPPLPHLPHLPSK